jgi:hypothetical protein
MVSAGHCRPNPARGTPQFASHAWNGLPLYSKPELRSRSWQHEPTRPTSIRRVPARSVKAARFASRCASFATSHGSPRQPYTSSHWEALARPGSNASGTDQGPPTSAAQACLDTYQRELGNTPCRNIPTSPCVEGGSAARARESRSTLVRRGLDLCRRDRSGHQSPNRLGQLEAPTCNSWRPRRAPPRCLSHRGYRSYCLACTSARS